MHRVEPDLREDVIIPQYLEQDVRSSVLRSAQVHPSPFTAIHKWKKVRLNDLCEGSTTPITLTGIYWKSVQIPTSYLEVGLPSFPHVSLMDPFCSLVFRLSRGSQSSQRKGRSSLKVESPLDLHLLFMLSFF